MIFLSPDMERDLMGVHLSMADWGGILYKKCEMGDLSKTNAIFSVDVSEVWLRKT